MLTRPKTDVSMRDTTASSIHLRAVSTASVRLATSPTVRDAKNPVFNRSIRAVTPAPSVRSMRSRMRTTSRPRCSASSVSPTLARTKMPSMISRRSKRPRGRAVPNTAPVVIGSTSDPRPVTMARASNSHSAGRCRRSDHEIRDHQRVVSGRSTAKANASGSNPSVSRSRKGRVARVPPSTINDRRPPGMIAAGAASLWTSNGTGRLSNQRPVSRTRQDIHPEAALTPCSNVRVSESIGLIAG